MQPPPPDEAYRRALVDTASIPRAILLLYDRLILLLKQALALSVLRPAQARQTLAVASQVLTHLIALFAHSEDPAYQQLQLSHEHLAQELQGIFRAGGNAAHRIAILLQQLRTYRDSWRWQLNIRRRHHNRPGPLNIRLKPPDD